MTAERENTAYLGIPQSGPPAEAAPESGCCGGGCCGDGGSGAEAGSVTAVYQVSGMASEHCEGAVSLELAELSGVTGVTAVAATGQVTVVSLAPLDERTVRSVLDEAGYGLVGRA
ncbi:MULTISPECIES: heavy-metal-associated domain-containing protein [unclassified Streptomyces]|uniref:heavy-metal-associated domain-containing protein n=1 Tax=unclassified Streptomyces TaxID=2593676 RepID=UPI002E1AAF2A|nr:heavy-metal-associated domain-containing protein [Streptomyces sp. NBC_01023]